MKPAKGSSLSILALLVLLLIVIFARFSLKQHAGSEEPLTYRIGSVDPKFGLSAQDVSESVKEAVSIWEKALNKELFKEKPDGIIEIKLVYDYRQEAADKLKGISGNIDNSKGSYDALTAHYEKISAEVKQQETSLSEAISAYNVRMNTFKTQSEEAARNGSAQQDMYNKLTEEKNSLVQMHEDLSKRQDELKKNIETLNNLVVVINEIANNLNLDAVSYNNVGKDLGNEFNEGVYQVKNNTGSITIYHFNSREALLRVLAHELGHALGVKHNNNPKAIMYRLNQSTSLELAPEDIIGLKK